jgi:hypothetical protein
MCFAWQGVCVMRYCGLMRYAMQFPAHQLGGHKSYVLSGVMRYQGYVLRGSQLYSRTSHKAYLSKAYPWPSPEGYAL